MSVGLDPVELAAGMVFGAGPAIALPTGVTTPRAAIAAAVAPALARPPCLVSFSGGRDSSAVLAVATAVARRAGLPHPVPATIRVADAPRSEERAWQELVVGHLGLRDWVRLELGDELDLVGPVARRALLEHGLLWPFNAHFHVPLLEAAAGGSLLTGIGGDELFRGATCPRSLALLRGRQRPRRADLRGLIRDLAPRRVRAGRLRRRADRLPWLTAAGHARVAAARAEQAAAEPLGLRPRMRRLRALRYLATGTGALDRLARDAGVSIAHPLLEPTVWAAVARAAAPAGYRSRAAAMQALFGDLLPIALSGRADKAGFNEVFLRAPSRAFAASWDGSGVPAELVDPVALREHWLSPAPLAQSFTLLQAAWLTAAGSAPERVEQPRGGLGEDVPAARAAQPPDRQ